MEDDTRSDYRPDPLYVEQLEKLCQEILRTRREALAAFNEPTPSINERFERADEKANHLARLFEQLEQLVGA